MSGSLGYIVGADVVSVQSGEDDANGEDVVVLMQVRHCEIVSEGQ